MKQLRIISFCWLTILISTFSYCQDYEPLIQKATEFYENEQYEKATIEFEKALPLIEEEYGALDTSYYVNQLTYTAHCFQQIQQYEKAEKYFRQSLSIYDSIEATNCRSYANGLHNLAKLYYFIGQYKEADSLYMHAVEIFLIQVGENNLSFASVLNDYGALCYQMGQYKRADTLYSQTIKIYEDLEFTNSTKYLTTLNNLGLLYWELGQYKKAEPIFLRVAEIAEVQLGKDHPKYALFLNNVALIYHAQGQYKKAEPIFIHAKEIAKKNLGENHPDYGLYLSNLGQLYFQLGYYELAVEYYKQVLELDKNTLGETHPYYINDLNNLAACYRAMGLFEKAEPLFQQMIRIGLSELGENHTKYAIYLNNLGTLYLDMERFEMAEPLLLQAYNIDKENFGENHPNFAKKSLSLASLYKSMGDYNKAEKLYFQALEIQISNFGENHPINAQILNNLSSLYYEMEKFKEGVQLLDQAINIIKSQFGESNIYLATLYNTLGMIYMAMGNYNDAEIYLNQSIVINKTQWGENHPDQAMRLNNLADLYQIQGNVIQSGKLYQQAFDIYKYQIKTNTSFLSSVELDKFLNGFQYKTNIYQSFIYQNNLNNGAFSYDIELSFKGILLKSALGVKNRIVESNDTTLINTYYDLRSLRNKINKQTLKPPDERSEDLTQLEVQANELEKTLTLKSKDYQKAQKENEITWQDVKKNLNPNEAAIEFSSFIYYNGKESTDSILYCAIVLKYNDTIPQMIYLCEESELLEVSPQPGASNRNINYLYHEPKLYELIWKPIDNLLDGINTVYYAPSGLLNSVSMVAISTPKSKPLFEKYNLVQLSSTRMLALEKEPISITDAVVYGGIIYDTDTTTLINKTEAYKEGNSDILAYNRSYTGDYRSGFQYLPGSQEEAESISLMAEKNNITVSKYFGTDAVEESFLSLSGNESPSVIHISTHGFYFPDTVSDENRKNIMYSSTGEKRFRYNDDPLLRSGLLLAGANLAWKGEAIPDNIEDGILTAKEVSNMNLMNTDLVILSACQSGLGDVKGSEGVEGLQRGFKMAGVRYIIMSLWQVPDKETTEFMVKFYDHWLAGKNIHEAFHHTQKHMHHKYKDDPFKWAGFVLME